MSSCTNPTHDHFEPVDVAVDHGVEISPADVVDIDGFPMIPFKCHDCGQPTHYDTSVDQYRHDDLEVECFLVPPFEPTDNPCEVSE